MCSSLEHDSGMLTGRYQGRQCVLEEKVRRVRERYDLTRFSAIHAYGDTPEDRPLLAIASTKYYRWQEIGAQ
ncbi:haloacid dehalogenase-like hydrolase [Luteimonas sp. MJ146]|uniref:haloacid dehalogenase-like hydrolase n=1 Tax=Luteimonas sp. MJ146 TaxID=3129240 RepID=UPI0031BA4FD8